MKRKKKVSKFNLLILHIFLLAIDFLKTQASIKITEIGFQYAIYYSKQTQSYILIKNPIPGMTHPCMLYIANEFKFDFSSERE